MALMRALLAVAVAVVCMAGFASAKANCSLIKDCKSCVKNFDCFWCPSYNKTKCASRTTFQLTTPCPKTYYLYPTCSISGLTLLILVAVGLSLFVILLGALIYCCCCRSSSSRFLRRDEERDRTMRADRTRRQDERRQERQSRINDIRKKYGLGTEERYQKM